MDCKDQILNHMQDTYNNTGWPFFSMTSLTLRFGPETRNVLNVLSNEGKVRARDSIRGKLYELIIN